MFDTNLHNNEAHFFHLLQDVCLWPQKEQRTENPCVLTLERSFNRHCAYHFKKDRFPTHHQPLNRSFFKRLSRKNPPTSIHIPRFGRPQILPKLILRSAIGEIVRKASVGSLGQSGSILHSLHYKYGQNDQCKTEKPNPYYNANYVTYRGHGSKQGTEGF